MRALHGCHLDHSLMESYLKELFLPAALGVAECVGDNCMRKWEEKPLKKKEKKMEKEGILPHSQGSHHTNTQP